MKQLLILLILIITYLRSDKLFNFGEISVVGEDHELVIPNWEYSPYLGGFLLGFCVTKNRFETKGFLTAYNCQKEMQNDIIYNCYYFESRVRFGNYYKNVLQNEFSDTFTTSHYFTTKNITDFVKEEYNNLTNFLKDKMLRIEKSITNGENLKTSMSLFWDEIKVRSDYILHPKSNTNLCDWTINIYQH